MLHEIDEEMVMKRFVTSIAALVLLAASAVAFAQYPQKPIRLIVPFPPGGSNDIVARQVGQELTGRLGQQVIVDNRGGAGGMIGTETAANSKPDGYTLLIISVAYAYNPAIYKSMLKYDPEKSFVPVSILGRGPNALTVHPQLPVKTVKDLVALAKAKPGALNYASAGIGSFQHLSSEMFNVLAGVKIVHVPFKGGGPAMADVIAGNTQLCVGSLIQVIPHVRSGRLRALATGGAKRVPAMADVPTVAESGVAGYEANNWWGILAPAGISNDIVSKLHSEIAVVLKGEDIRKRFESEGAETLIMSSADFGKYIRSETARWGKVVREANIKPE
jgi:tripartite-type tricarboxylate transporter receptor subunit TctC